MTTPIRILGIAGSLRRGSYNRAALRAATELAPKDATVETFELDGIPPFNQDEEQNPPAKVAELKRRIAIMGASTGAIGTARAQNHLRQILVYLNMFPIRQVCHYSQTTAGG